ncbi:hypothetical protein D3C73_1359070 [compost metagenome]
MGHAYIQQATGQLQGQQLVVDVVVSHQTVDHHARVVTLCQRQVEPRQGFADRSAGQGLAGAQQHDVIGQARDFVLGMADVQHRYFQFVVQPLKVRQDLAFAL